MTSPTPGCSTDALSTLLWATSGSRAAVHRARATRRTPRAGRPVRAKRGRVFSSPRASRAIASPRASRDREDARERPRPRDRAPRERYPTRKLERASVLGSPRACDEAAGDCTARDGKYRETIDRSSVRSFVRPDGRERRRASARVRLRTCRPPVQRGQREMGTRGCVEIS